ncbi:MULTISPECIES: hypothetical protein [unclassified Rhizobium]|uniref:hypothetical protein n=1 Tax=unclassified Rhizobium TaxID=2613769 RepID=UPI001C83F47C|nr:MULTISPECIES: hypothetical protein [unclassified Rhizobium]MBX5166272.1 hypothetical protein [Rhizobium sp. NZLR4b]MBX5168619.1 hypothetical protein [Rhizobium sp. NZLR1b]MBX5210143.1 hypothetical protein [Rhizobium sp. NZLR11]
METQDPAAQVPLLSQKEKRRHLTLEAMVSVDEGNTVDHRFVQAWADSLDGDRPVLLSS